VAWTGPGIATRTVIAGQYLTPTDTGCSGWCPNWIAPGHGVRFDSFATYAGVLLSDIPTGTLSNGSSVVPTLSAPADRGENHGTRLRALLTAPFTGQYTFWVASDDEGRLYLSTDSNPANRSVIARVDGWVPAGQYDQQANQRSAPITLVAGQTYFVEAYAKEGGGGDHLSVAWSGPGIPGREVVPAAFLVPSDSGCAGWCA
jgi:hypothetical protein